MSLEPRVYSNDGHQRLVKREELASRVDVSLGLGSFLKKTRDKILGKKEKVKVTVIDPDFDEKQHPRGPDGKFIKEGGSLSQGLKKVIESIPTRKIDCRPGKKGEKVTTVNPNVGRGIIQDILKEDPLLNKIIRPKAHVKGQVCSVKTNRGKELSLYETGPNKLTTDKKRELLNALADLHEIYPNWPKVNIVIGPMPKMKTGDEAAGHASFKDNVMSLSDRYEFNGHDSGMEYLNKTPIAKAVVYHEFGHLFDGKMNGVGLNNAVFGGSTRKLFKDKNIRKYLSPYGQTHEFEGYAEAFAEWHVSRGKTENPAAIAYAKHQKWYTFAPGKTLAESALSLEQGVTLSVEEQEGIIILDTFDPKIGSEVLGGYSFKELTPEEDAAIDKLIRQVFKELKVPYEE